MSAKQRPRTSPVLNLVKLSSDAIPIPVLTQTQTRMLGSPKFTNTPLTAQFPFAPPLIPSSPDPPPRSTSKRLTDPKKPSSAARRQSDLSVNGRLRSSSTYFGGLPERTQSGASPKGVSRGSIFGLPNADTLRISTGSPRNRSPLRSVSPKRRPNTVGSPRATQKGSPFSSPRRVPLTGVDPDVQERAALPALFKQKGALETLRPSTGEAWGGQGVHFADSEDNWPHRPQLAANLEAFLEEKLRIADRLAAGHGPRSGHSHAAANMALDAHRQTFEAFIAAFTTYRPLLQRIRAEYDGALNDGMRSAHDAVHMRAELAVQEQRMARAVEESQMDSSATAANMRAEMYNRLLQTEERAAAAEAAAAAAEIELKTAQGQLRTAKDDAESLKEDIRELRQSMVAASTWGSEIMVNK